MHYSSVNDPLVDTIKTILEAKFVVPQNLQVFIDEIGDLSAQEYALSKQIEKLQGEQQKLYTKIDKVKDRYYVARDKISDADMSSNDHDKLNNILIKALDRKK